MSCATTPLNQAQIQQLARNAGFSAAMAPLMSAIAMAESGGCPTAINPNDNGGTQTSWGLWQISNGTHQVLAGWNNPQTNAQMAYAKYQSQGLGAWGTYTSGAYKPFLSGSGNVDTATASATTGAGAAGGICDTPVVGGFICTVQNIFTQFTTLFSWLTNPIRIIKLLIGIVMIIASFILFLSPEGEQVGKEALREGIRSVQATQ